jgi:hypothetical protein
MVDITRRSGQRLLHLILAKDAPTSSARTKVSKAHVASALAWYICEFASTLTAPKSSPSIQGLACYQQIDTILVLNDGARLCRPVSADPPYETGQFAPQVGITARSA